MFSGEVVGVVGSSGKDLVQLEGLRREVMSIDGAMTNRGWRLARMAAGAGVLALLVTLVMIIVRIPSEFVQIAEGSSIGAEEKAPGIIAKPRAMLVSVG